MSTVPQHSTQRIPSPSLCERVHGRQAAPPPPPALRGTVDPAALGSIATVVRLIASEHLDHLAERTGGLVAADQPQMRTAIESAVDAAIREAWDGNSHTEPRRRDRPERNRFESGGVA